MSHLHHRNITVFDLEASKRFYRDALGFEFQHDEAVPDRLAPLFGAERVDACTAYLRNAEDVGLALTQFVYPTASGPREKCSFEHFGYTHLAVYVGDMAVAAARLEAAGGTILSHTRARYDAVGVEMLYGTDPDGVRIELMTGPGIPPAFSHSGISVATIETALPFFAQLGFLPEESFDFSEPLAWTAKITETPGLRQRVQMIRNAARDTLELLEIIHPKPRSRGFTAPPTHYGFGGITLSVADIDSTVAALVRLGGVFQDDKRIMLGDRVMWQGSSPWDTRLDLISA